MTSISNICYIINALGELAQLARASALHAEGQGFESPILHQVWLLTTFIVVLLLIFNKIFIQLISSTYIELEFFYYDLPTFVNIIIKSHNYQKNSIKCKIKTVQNLK